MSTFKKGDKVKIAYKDQLLLNRKEFLEGAKGKITGAGSPIFMVAVQLESGEVTYISSKDLIPLQDQRTMKDLLLSRLIEGLLVTAVIATLFIYNVQNAYF